MKLLLVLLLACARPLHPMPDDPRAARAAHLVLQCGDWSDGDDDPWMGYKVGQAVLLDQHHAMTAAHIMACPDIYEARITLATGRELFVVPDGSSGGMMKLRPLGALDTFPVLPAPRAAAALGDQLCIYPGPRCGAALVLTSREVELDVIGAVGRSGAGVWRGGELVGIVQGISDGGRTVASLLVTQ